MCNLNHSKLIKDISFNLKQGEFLKLTGADRTEKRETTFSIKPTGSGEV